MNRRDFIKNSAAAGIAALPAGTMARAYAQSDTREFYELRTQQFNNSEEWKKLRSMPGFVDTVSATTIAFLRPAAYSQI